MDASMFRAWIHEAARSVTENADHLTRLDSAVGDADHGINMRRGLQAAVAMLDETDPSTPGAVLVTVGRALISKTGGASGPLYGTGFRQARGPWAKNQTSRRHNSGRPWPPPSPASSGSARRWRETRQ